MTTTPDPITVDATTLTDAGAFLRQIATAVGDGFRRMDAEIDGMAYWGGPAAAAFQSGWREASAGAVMLLSSLESMADLLGVQGDEFASVDETLAADLADTGPRPSSLNL
ncbi:WXG100 family type VII secretion target [Nocardia brevicatena]|uniref:WXG100 family type VII secretion target n=1 Tax=Nocardia brevicatena TaxID=37327 RepID=UPI0002DA04B4|nr:WXG100 family type VII secretion target [Nocardia brevicatena]